MMNGQTATLYDMLSCLVAIAVFVLAIFVCVCAHTIRHWDD